MREYIFVMVLICLRIIYDTRTNATALAYLLLVIFLRFFGIFFYLFFGTNYHKRKIYSKKLIKDETLAKKLKADIFQYSKQNFEQADPAIPFTKDLTLMLVKDSMGPLTANNDVKLQRIFREGENSRMGFPPHMIASHMKLTAETLSRIRRKLEHK